MSLDLVNEQAARVIELAGSGGLWAVRVDGASPEERAALIDHAEEVRREVCRRGFNGRSTVHREDGQEYVVVAVAELDAA